MLSPEPHQPPKPDPNVRPPPITESTSSDPLTSPLQDESLKGHSAAWFVIRREVHAQTERERVERLARHHVIKAVAAGELDMLIELMSAGAPINWPRGGALSAAIECRHWDIAQYLAEHGADARGIDLREVLSPVIIIGGDDRKHSVHTPDLVRSLVRAGATLNDPARPAMPFIEALHSKSGDDIAELCRAFFELGGDPTGIKVRFSGRFEDRVYVECGYHDNQFLDDGDPDSILINRALVQLFASHGRALEPRILAQFPDVEMAGESCDLREKKSRAYKIGLKVLKYEEHGDAVNANRLKALLREELSRPRLDAWPLTQAIRARMPGVAEILLECGADVNEGDGAPLVAALNQENLVRLLLSNGADPNVRFGAVLKELIESGASLSLLSELKAHGADFSFQNSRALRLIRGISNRISTFDWLLDAGCDLEEAGLIQEDSTPVQSLPTGFSYVRLMLQAANPDSHLFINKILPSHMHSKPGWGASRASRARLSFISNCAKAASSIIDCYEGGFHEEEASEELFLRFVKEGADRTINHGMKLTQLAERTSNLFKTQELEDIALAFAHSVLLPTVCAAVGPEKIRLDLPDSMQWQVNQLDNRLKKVACQILFEAHSALDLSRMVRQWHRLAHRHPVPLTSGVAWIPLVDPTEISPGYTMCALATPEELVAEGRQMQNCLSTGNYLASCVNGSIQILSLRHEGCPVVDLTIEKVEPDEAIGDVDWCFRTVACKAIANSEPSEEHLRQIDIFIERMVRGEILSVHPRYWGLTEESRELLQSLSTTPVEQAFGRSLRDKPSDALLFYHETVRAYSEGSPIGSPRVPFLRSINLAEIETLARDAVANSLYGKERKQFLLAWRRMEWQRFMKRVADQTAHEVSGFLRSIGRLFGLQR